MKHLNGHSRFDAGKIHLIITIGVMAFIFVHSAMPGDVSGNESRHFAEILASITGLSLRTAQFIVRKAAHFTEFMVLGICLAVNCNDHKAQNDLSKTEKNLIKQFIFRHPQIAAWIAGTLYACTDELHQLFVEGRSCELRDVCIDAAGVAIGVFIAQKNDRHR